MRPPRPPATTLGAEEDFLLVSTTTARGAAVTADGPRAGSGRGPGRRRRVALRGRCCQAPTQRRDGDGSVPAASRARTTPASARSRSPALRPQPRELAGVGVLDAVEHDGAATMARPRWGSRCADAVAGLISAPSGRGCAQDRDTALGDQRAVRTRMTSESQSGPERFRSAGRKRSSNSGLHRSIVLKGTAPGVPKEVSGRAPTTRVSRCLLGP